MAYEDQCGSCRKFEDPNGGPYDTSRSPYTKGHCIEWKRYYYPTEPSCSQYSSKDGCYITTIVCERLGKSDNCEELETLRKFRKEVLQKDKRYANLLYEYDAIGPTIAEHLRMDIYSMITGVFRFFLQPVVSCIKAGNNEKAVQKYKEMTDMLKDCYGIHFQETAPSDYSYKQGGHGKLFVKS